MKLDFSINTIVAAVLPAVIADAPPAVIASTAYAAVVEAAPNVAKLIATWREGEIAKKAVDASSTGVAKGLRTILKAQRVDVNKAADVRDTLRGAVWTDAGFAVILTKPSSDTALADWRAAAGCKTVKEWRAAGHSEETVMKSYNTISKRLERIATAIVDFDKPAAQRVAEAKAKAKAKTPVEKDLQAAINALVAAGYERKEMLAAVAHAFADAA